MAQTARQQALANLADKIPTANTQAAQGLSRAQDIQRRQQIAAMQPGQTSLRATAPMAAQQVASQGQAALQAQQQTQQQSAQVGQMELAGQEASGQQQLRERTLELSKRQNEMANQLSSLDEGAKQKIFDQRNSFTLAEGQREYLNQRQLADYAILSAQSEDSYRDAAQTVEQVYAKEMQIMENIYADMQKVLQRGYLEEGQKLDAQAKQELQQMLNDYEKKMNDKQNKANNNTAMWKAGGTIVGAVIGGYATKRPEGAYAGATIGAAAGTAISGA